MADEGRFVTFDRDDERKRVVMTLAGVISVEQWAASIADLIAQRMWTYAVVYDLRPASSALLLDRLASLAPFTAELMAEQGPRGPVAVVVPTTELAAWRTGLRAHFAGVIQIDAFADLESAHNWLDERTWRRKDQSK